jgi:hypothetical protein
MFSAVSPCAGAADRAATPLLLDSFRVAIVRGVESLLDPLGSRRVSRCADDAPEAPGEWPMCSRLDLIQQREVGRAHTSRCACRSESSGGTKAEPQLSKSEHR